MILTDLRCEKNEVCQRTGTELLGLLLELSVEMNNQMIAAVKNFLEKM